MKSPPFRRRSRLILRILQRAALAAAILLLAAGAYYRRKSYEPDADEFGVVTFSRVRDIEITSDSTFGGVVRKGARLYSTYDRNAEHGKRACPT